MTTILTYAFSRLMQYSLSMMSVVGTAAGAASPGSIAGWAIEQGTDEPGYAVVEPVTTNLNIDTVVLACEETWDGRRVLQLQLYPTNDGPLQPKLLQLKAAQG